MIPANELDITIRRIVTPAPDEPAEETYSVVIAPAFGDADPDAVTAALMDIIHEATGRRDPMTLSEQRSVYEWGASGAEWSYVVELAAGLDEVAIGIAIDRAFDKILTIVGNRRTPPPIDRDSALDSARWGLLRQNPSLDRDSLGLVAEEHDREANRWTFTFRPGDGWEYAAEIGWHGKLPGLTRVKRTASIPSDPSP